MMDKEIPKKSKDTPVLLIDFKKKRLRLHKNTLTLMGNPEFIQFLVNPDKQTLIITPSDPEDKLSHRIKWSLIADGQSCDFHSKHLVETLQIMFFPEAKASQRFYGEIIKADENIASFSLKNPFSPESYDDFERTRPHVCS